MIFLQILGALAMDQILGELRRWHPLVGYGRMVSACESALNPNSALPDDGSAAAGMAIKLRGVLACLLLIVPPVLQAQPTGSTQPMPSARK